MTHQARRLSDLAHKMGYLVIWDTAIPLGVIEFDPKLQTARINQTDRFADEQVGAFSNYDEILEP